MKAKRIIKVYNLQAITNVYFPKPVRPWRTLSLTDLLLVHRRVITCFYLLIAKSKHLLNAKSKHFRYNRIDFSITEYIV